MVPRGGFVGNHQGRRLPFAQEIEAQMGLVHLPLER